MELLLGILGLFLSFFCSGAETAFITSSKIRFEIWLRHNVQAAQLAEKYFRNPHVYLSVTLVGNTAATIIATSYGTVFLIRYMDQSLAWIIITLTILVLGEILPKVIFNIHANQLILNLIYPIRILNFILKPIVALATRISGSVLKRLPIDKSRERTLFDKKDVEIIMREARLAGVVDEEEHKIIKHVLRLSEKLVKQAMVPRTSMIAVDSDTPLERIRSLMAKTGFTKIPVFKDTIDNIIGITSLYDLLYLPLSLEEIIKPAVYTPENKRCDQLLREFWRSNNSLSIVIDEYGGTAGLVTIEDLMEELFGEIEESSNLNVKSIRALNKNTFQVPAVATIESVNESLHLAIPEGEYETIAGFILSKIERFPSIGEKIILPDCRIIITKTSRKRIEEVRIIKRN